MRFLLPPSETKRDGTVNVPLALEQLIAPELTGHRERVLRAITKLCAKPTPRVRTAIGTTASQDLELLRNATLLTAPTAPASDIYDGVLFDAMELATASAAVRARIDERVLVQSALFGVVAFTDHIPAYRCSADSTLPRIGRMGTFWRKQLDAVMPAIVGEHVLLDLRSGSYTGMWKPTGEMLDRSAIVKVMQMRGGKRLAVSHFNKATKGKVIRSLSSTSSELRSVDDAVNRLAKAGFEVELLRAGTGVTLEVMMR